MQQDELNNLLKEGESEHLAFRLFFGHESIETLTAFANSQGGVLLLGISELKEIKGVPDAKENIEQWIKEIHTRTSPRLYPHVEIFEIEKKDLVYISVAEYPVKPVAFEGKYFKRFNKFTKELSIQETIDFRRETMDSHWDSNLKEGKTINDISFEKLHRQIERISRKKQSVPDEPLTFLRKYGLTEGNAITNACWLLFLPDEEPQATIELGRFSSPTITTDTLTLKTDLFTEAEEAMQFICKHICKETNENTPAPCQYPLDAMRELVVNMIIHRDYTSDYNSIIKIFDGYIEFYNPGSFPDTLTIRRLLSNGFISRPRNPQIVELFKDAGMFEEYGSGIRKICTAFTDKGLRLPEFIKLPGRLIVRVFGDTATEVVDRSIVADRSEVVKQAAVVDRPEVDKQATVVDRPEVVKRIVAANHAVTVENSSLFNHSDFIENNAVDDSPEIVEHPEVVEHSDVVESSDIVENSSFQEQQVETLGDDDDSELSPENENESFSAREQQIIELITKNDRIPLNDIANTLTVSKRTILRDIKKMKNGKILERIGSEKNGYWRVKMQSFS